MNLQIGRAEFANSKLNLQIQFEFANYLQIQFEFANWCGFSEILNAFYLFKHVFSHGWDSHGSCAPPRGFNLIALAVQKH